MAKPCISDLAHYRSSRLILVSVGVRMRRAPFYESSLPENLGSDGFSLTKYVKICDTGRVSMSIIDQYQPEFVATIQHLESDLQSLRTGRASSALIEDVRVEAYGSSTDLKSIASISIPDAKTIQIEPWDKSLVGAVEKALIIANLGMQPNVAGSVIRLNLPQMTEENRRAIVKQVHEKAEHARIAIRTVRETVRDAINTAEKNKEIAEDEKFRLQEQLEKKMKDVNESIQEIADKKETEIMTI